MLFCDECYGGSLVAVVGTGRGDSRVSGRVGYLLVSSLAINVEVRTSGGGGTTNLYQRGREIQA